MQLSLHRETVTLGSLYAEPSRNGLNRPKAVRGAGIKMVNMGELFANRMLKNTEMDLVPFDFEKENRFLLEPGDLLFARQSLVLEGAGKCVLFDGDIDAVTFESHITRIRLDNTKVCPKYVFYFFESQSGKDTISQIVEQGAGAAGIRGSQLETLKIPLPPLAEQRRIADILGTLDDKIALNRRMNATLEAMARALFKSWFVDFDPVHAKSAGRPTGLPAHIEALFPDSFVDSALGPIPAGWAVGKVSDIAYVSSGKRPEVRFDSMTSESSVPLYGGGGRIGYVMSPLFMNPILITGRVGTLGSIFRSINPSWPSDNTLVIEPHAYFFDFAYFTLKGFNLNLLNRGSTQPLLTQTDLKSQQLILPDNGEIKAFSEYSDKFFAQIHINLTNIHILTTLRDTLLPKLLNGELAV
jgi:type I restriction enzyme S subunit